MTVRSAATTTSVVTSVALLSALPLIRYSRPEAIVVSGLAITVLVVSRSVRAALVALFVAFVFAWMATPYGYGWPANLGLPLASWAVVVAAVPPLRRGVRWLRIGSFERPVPAWLVATVLISVVALCAWYAALRPNLADLTRNLPPWSGAKLVLAAFGFSLLNAVLEETIWRGVIMDGLDEALGPGSLALIVQAASFGLFHVHGFPRGAVGVALAFVYGLMLGVVRRRAGGLGPPVLAHFCADLTIAVLLVSIAA